MSSVQLTDWHREFDQDLKGLDRMTPRLLKSSTIQLPTPTKPQQTALDHQARFLVNRWGRGAGKSHASLHKLHTSAMRVPGLYWWVWPTMKAGREFAWEQYIRPFIGPYLPLRESTLTVHYPNGSRLQVVGADKSHAHNMRGGAVHGAVFDECRNMIRQVWTEIAMPMIARTSGWAWFNSTPRGMDWFWKLYANAETLPEWGRLHFTSYDNQHVKRSEIDRMKTEMTEREFQQEIMAEFLADGGLIFRNIDDICSGRPKDPQRGHSYLIGADWALKHDSTVFSVFDVRSRAQVHEASYRGVDSLMQAQSLINLSRRYNGATVISETNFNEACTRLVARAGVDVIDWTTTAASKKLLIDAAVLAFEDRRVTLLDTEGNRSEFMSFEMKPGGGSLPRYGAPEGMHDDRVIAACLAIYGMERALSLPESRADLMRKVAF